MVLTNREKLLLAVLFVLLVITGVYYTFQGMAVYERGLEQQLTARNILLRRALSLQAQMETLTPAARPTTRRRPLIGYIEQLSARIQLKDRIQLNLIPQERSGGLQGVDIKVDDLSLDEMVDLVYILESADRPLVIDRFEVSPSFRAKQRLRLSMRVLATE